MTIIFWIRLLINSFESFVNILNVGFSPVQFSFPFFHVNLLKSSIYSQ